MAHENVHVKPGVFTAPVTHSKLFLAPPPPPPPAALKLQELVYDILPSITAVFSYATGP